MSNRQFIWPLILIFNKFCYIIIYVSIIIFKMEYFITTDIIYTIIIDNTGEDVLIV